MNLYSMLLTEKILGQAGVPPKASALASLKALSDFLKERSTATLKTVKFMDYNLAVVKELASHFLHGLPREFSNYVCCTKAHDPVPLSLANGFFISANSSNSAAILIFMPCLVTGFQPGKLSMMRGAILILISY